MAVVAMMTRVRPPPWILKTTVDTVVGNVPVPALELPVDGLLGLDLGLVHEDVQHDGNLCN